MGTFSFMQLEMHWAYISWFLHILTYFMFVGMMRRSSCRHWNQVNSNICSLIKFLYQFHHKRHKQQAITMKKVVHTLRMHVWRFVLLKFVHLVKSKQSFTPIRVLQAIIVVFIRVLLNDYLTILDGSEINVIELSAKAMKGKFWDSYLWNFQCHRWNTNWKFYTGVPSRICSPYTSV